MTKAADICVRCGIDYGGFRRDPIGCRAYGVYSERHMWATPCPGCGTTDDEHAPTCSAPTLAGAAGDEVRE